MPRSLPKIFFEKRKPVVLVAGGAGFIGSHICEELLSRGCEVICCDNWQTGIKENIENLKEETSFHFLEHDITDEFPKSLPKTDYIIHAAGVEAYLNGEDLSVETLLVNSKGTENLLTLAQKDHCRFLLISSIDIFAARASLESLRDYFGKTAGAFAHHEAKRFAEALTAQYFTNKRVDARVVRITHVFGPKMMLTTGSPIANLIRATVYSKDLEIPSPGNQKFYPIYISDAVEQITKSLFAPGTSGKIFYLIGKPVTVFEFAKTLVEVSGKALEVRTVAQEFKEPVLPENVEYSQTFIEAGLAQTLKFFEEHKSAVPRPKKLKIEGGREFTGVFLSFKNLKKIFLALVASFLVIFFVLPIFQFLLGISLIFVTKQTLERGLTEIASASAQASTMTLSASKKGFARFGISPLENLAQTLEITSRAAQKAVKVASFSRILLANVLGSANFDVKSFSGELTLSLSDLAWELGFLEAELSVGQTVPFLPNFDLTRARAVLVGLSKISAELPEILGQGGRKTYLILFQNNMELRPTGGFIGSFALVTFEGGRLADLKVQDVYQADGKLLGHIEPPSPIKEYLGEAGWYLRDSNWDPHFPTSAARAAWFLDKEIGVAVDGVIGVDLEFAKRIIGEIGPIILSDFGETVTADNLYERTQYQAEANFFPGSRQKEDFLTALARTLLAKVTSQIPKPLFGIVNATFSALEERHIQVYLTQNLVQKEISALFWDGGAKNIGCQDLVNCKASSLFVVEANLGVNKANYYLQRNLDLDIFLSQDQILHKVSVIYTNSSKQDAWPGGTYKNYMRIYVPKGSKIVLAKFFDSQSQEGRELEVVISEERDFSVFGFLLEVPPDSTRRLEFSWQSESSISLTNPGQFLFFWQKQAGVGEDPATIRFHYPQPYELAANPSPSLTQPGLVSYNINLASDITVQLTW